MVKTKIQTKKLIKRVLETIEIDFLASYYNQEGSNASVTGERVNEDLEDFNPTVVLNIPIGEDDILTLDYGISTYTSAHPVTETHLMVEEIEIKLRVLGMLHQASKVILEKFKC